MLFRVGLPSSSFAGPDSIILSVCMFALFLVHNDTWTCFPTRSEDIHKNLLRRSGLDSNVDLGAKPRSYHALEGSP